MAGVALLKYSTAGKIASLSAFAPTIYFLTEAMKAALSYFTPSSLSDRLYSFATTELLFGYLMYDVLSGLLHSHDWYSNNNVSSLTLLLKSSKSWLLKIFQVVPLASIATTPFVFSSATLMSFAVTHVPMYLVICACADAVHKRTVNIKIVRLVKEDIV